MRISWLLPLITLASPILVKAASAATEDEDAPKSTKFNDIEVPPIKEIQAAASIDEDIKNGYWLVEFFSPYCHHCKQQAPIWQTMYEYYYTLDPLATSKSKPTTDDDTKDLNSFTRYYNFHFAKVDCVAFGTSCSEKKIDSFPTIILFKDGVEVKREVGTQSLKELSQWIEETLESIRPGSRPADGPKLPKVGAHSVEPAAKLEKSEQKDKDPEAGRKAGEKHNAAAAAEAAASASEPESTTETAAVKKPVRVPNPNGRSVPLTAESFQRLVTTTRDPWFVKFYSPVCSHCIAMAPNWASMAREMQGVINVGEVDCMTEKRLCKDAKIKGYPTMLFFRGGERVEYDGLRGVGDLTSFARKASEVGAGVQRVSAEQFEKLEKTEEVIFVYFYDHATVTEDFEALERLTLSLVGHAKLVKTNDPELYKRFKISTWPRLMVSRSGKPSYYAPLAPKDMRDTRKVLTWMKSVWHPLVPELTAQNAHEIMTNKHVVLGILSKERESEFNAAKKELKNAALEWIDREQNAIKLQRQELRDAKQLRIEEAEDRNDAKALRAAKAIRIKMEDIERKDVRFMWVDGMFWERWIKTTFGVDVRTDGERVIIYDEGSRRYWDQTSTGNPIVPSRTSILETLPKTLKNPPTLPPKSTHSNIFWFFWKLKNTWSRHPYLSFLGLISMSGVAVVLGRRARRRSGSNGGSIWLDEKGNAFGGILGVGHDVGGGKTD
ncbi:uncharacterized protein PV09_03274 [Verruconis gallopava]|uniref:Thioredoxin domain-containing protein n=1 Tax=Verruconis gallopava TaxID=253628 RepID=A0A0D1XTN2_9PEZI|nr:uncharacterized protein PV09_03274 [Verruconis gallopava]KIW06106.1 hypothetical protein PV09_03274 [Verruconis gallopava]